MADNKVGGVYVEIGANTAGLTRGMQEAATSVRQSVGQMKSHFAGISSAMAGFGAAFAAVGAVLAGGKVFKDAISATVGWTTENVKLARTLGITTEEASVLNVALGDVLASTDQYVRGVQMMTRQINAGGKGFKELGIDVRDSQGHLRASTDIMTDAIAKLNSLKAGTDRNVAASKIFGRAWMEILPVLKLTNESMEEAKTKAEALGLVVGPEQAAKVRAYRIAMHEVHEVFEALKISIGTAVMPALTRLAQWFQSVGPTMVKSFSVGIKVLTTIFSTLTTGLEQVSATVSAAILSIVDIVGAIGPAFNALVHGNFAGAAETMKAAAVSVKDRWVTAFEQMTEAGHKWADGIKMTWNPPAAAKSKASPGTGDETLPAPAADNKAFLAAMKEQGEYEMQVAADVRDAKIAALKAVEDAAENDDEKRRAAALNLAMLAITSYGEGSQEAIRAMSHVADVERGINERRKANALTLAQARDQYELQVLDIQEQAVQRSYELAEISGEQEIEQLRRIEEQKNEIRRGAIERQLADQTLTVTQRALLNQELESLELTHAATMDEIELESLARLKGYTDAFVMNWTSTWAQGIEEMLNGTMKLSDGVRGIFTTMRQGLSRTLAQIAQDWIQTHLKMYVFKVALRLKELIFGQAADKAAAATTAATATSQVGSNAAVAASGAAASAAAIPYVGWAIAIGAAVAVLASVLAFRSNISASGGFDIPGGLNPVTQLHQKEMVLPAPLAERVRNMTAPTKAAPVTNITNVFNVTAGQATVSGLKDLRSTLSAAGGARLALSVVAGGKGGPGGRGGFGIAGAAADAMHVLRESVSAAGGWDVGASMPSLAQLHQKEMVLPAPLAERVRGMTEQDEPRREGDTHLHVHGVADAPSFEAMLRRHDSGLVKVLNELHRNGRSKVVLS